MYFILSIGGMLFAVNGPDITFNNTVQGFVIGLTSQQLVAVFKPGEKGLSNPHDIAVSNDGKQIYVVQLDPSRVWKFVESKSFFYNS
jgi:peptidylamidoglycolate lyase